MVSKPWPEGWMRHPGSALRAMAGTEAWGGAASREGVTAGGVWAGAGGNFPPAPNSSDCFVTGKCGLDAEAGFSLALHSDWQWVMAGPDKESPSPGPSWVKNPWAGSIQGHDYQTSSRSLNSQCWILYKDGKEAGPALNYLKQMQASKEQKVTMPAKSILSTTTAQKNKGLLKTHKWQS